MSSRYPVLLLGLILGIAAGLLYGWVIRPVEYFDTSPDALRIDYQTDYVLMVAESFSSDQNLELARVRLASLGPETPDTYLTEALLYATQEEFSSKDLDRLEELLQAFSVRSRSEDPS
jgi:hypothetical protein